MNSSFAFLFCLFLVFFDWLIPFTQTELILLGSSLMSPNHPATTISQTSSYDRRFLTRGQEDLLRLVMTWQLLPFTRRFLSNLPFRPLLPFKDQKPTNPAIIKVWENRKHSPGSSVPSNRAARARISRCGGRAGLR
ncbi:uncharacterized protein BO95DRAFT_139575 [Aspergillus brunneoviolaceus CBS 621.78]|uniref:Uncharacterized protein n=1 Tax=Aspergillus brunneoviolaceus CBS 621.78 TaxID=1450534 RepID=A0ACD1G926_9EURO|nr:hypothetical protein BO95DRAFT_139575 [Aspergillus brunneoviolaceus CBS 621.78]RAH45634.1 hypothetical protein BO95DRAFT_139575 [Aspergillus brunneoviolaceus CBS 621.78]